MNKTKLLFPFLAAALILTGCGKGNGEKSSSQGSSAEQSSGESSGSQQSSESSSSSGGAYSSEGSEGSEASSEQSSESSESSESSSGSSSEQQGGVVTEWPADLQADLLDYIGEVVPVAPLNLDSLYYGFSLFGDYMIYDDNQNDVLGDYGEKLESVGYTADVDDYGDECYIKEKDDGVITIYAGFDPAEGGTYEPGNVIDIYFEPVLSEDDILEAGYEKVTGWPATLIEATIDGTDSLLEVPEFYINSFWYVASDLVEDDGDYYMWAGLAIPDSHASEYQALLEDAGYDIEDDYYATDPAAENGHEIEFFDSYGWFFINVYGPYIDEPEDPITVDALIEAGYEKVEGWPKTMVDAFIEGTDVAALTGVNLEGDWYALGHEADGIAILSLFTEGSYSEALDTNLQAAGFEYYDTVGMYLSEYGEVYAMIMERDGFTGLQLIKQTEVPVVDGDVLDQEAFGLTDGTSSYDEYDATGESGASYHAQCAAAHGIQIRSKNSNSGIIGHLADAVCDAISFTINENTYNGRTIDIYASNEEFSIADMYSGEMEPVASLVYDAESNATLTYVFEGEYEYIGIRSNDGAIYFDQIIVAWSALE